MQQEKRTYNIELRASGEGRTIEGYAAKYDSETDLGGFREIIERGAFDAADVSDVRALFNHDPNYPLGRTKGGTLTLSTDDEGLFYRFEAPNTTFGDDLLALIRSGVISQSSFAFTIEKEDWEKRDGDKAPLRRIKEVRAVYDVSPVTYPAYEETTVTARKKQEFNQREEPKEWVLPYFDNFLTTVE